jgi:hypothetical protein
MTVLYRCVLYIAAGLEVSFMQLASEVCLKLQLPTLRYE